MVQDYLKLLGEMCAEKKAVFLVMALLHFHSTVTHSHTSLCVYISCAVVVVVGIM